MSKVYILAAKRTAIGGFQGSFANTGAVELGTVVTRAILAESGVNPECVNEVIFGNVLSAGLGQNVSRQIALKSGIPAEVPSYTLNKVCGSGMKSVQLAYQSIITGENDVVIAGGTENMTLSPHILACAREGLKLGSCNLEDSLIKDGLSCSVNGYHMGITAENLAKKYNISREDQDKFALESQQKAAVALAEERFKDEIVPVQVKQRKQTVEIRVDEHPRETSLEKLAGLRPVFDSQGTVTAGNSSGINDGAAALILAGEEFVKKNNLKPIAVVEGFAASGVDPEIMGIGPVSAISKLLQKTNTNLSDVDLFELNEAFAVQSLAVLKETGINPGLVNVNGGAIALGHPIGASGARIMVSLIHEMQKRGSKTGIASLCIGGGMGIASLISKEN